jgi:hypothetical protein
MRRAEQLGQWYSDGEIQLTIEALGKLGAVVRQQRAEINALRTRLTVAEKRLALRVFAGGRSDAQ